MQGALSDLPKERRSKVHRECESKHVRSREVSERQRDGDEQRSAERPPNKTVASDTTEEISTSDSQRKNIMTVKWQTSTVRNVLAFWLFGLCNNYGYVIMLSAAEDIMSKQKHEDSDNSTDIHSCATSIQPRVCTSRASTGAVLLADVLPSLIIKLTLPFFVQKIPYGFRHFAIVGFQVASYFVVAYSSTYAMSLAGVVLAACGSGLGEITYLSLSSHFTPITISAWSSGTGGAGVVGSFAYAALTEPHMGNLSPKNALLVMLVVPFLFALSYWVVLDCPPTVYTPGFNPKTWIVPAEHDGEPAIAADTGEKNGGEVEKNQSGRVSQRVTTFKEKLMLILPLLKLMIPLSTVYFAEYLINQGLVQLIWFDCAHGFHLAKSSQYRWYQVLYQVGVFISRSSVNIIQLPMLVLYLLPVLQIANAVFFFFDAMYSFVPNILITFILILIEGLYGGSSYVNTFNWIHKNVEPDVKEFSLSIASTGDAIGIVCSALLAIKIHNFICDHMH